MIIAPKTIVSQIVLVSGVEALKMMNAAYVVVIIPVALTVLVFQMVITL